MKNILFPALLSLLFFTGLDQLQSQQNPQVKIGFFGNSITAGSRLSNPGEECYPAQFADMLAKIYNDTVLVKKFAVSGRTMLKNGDYPLWDEKVFTDGLNFEPDICFILLGTNDTKSQNWDKYGNEFFDDYLSMVNTLKSRNSTAKFIVCYPPRAFEDAYGIRDAVIVNGVIPVIDSILKVTDAILVDFYTALYDKVDLFPDKIHPNVEGAKLMAELIYSKFMETDLIHQVLYGNSSVTGVGVSPTTASIHIGETQQLTETVSPAYATNKKVSWSSSNASVCTVSSTGLVTGVGAGSAAITVTTKDGGFTAICNVSVTDISTPTYQLTTSVNGQGSVSPSSGSYIPNSEVTLTATSSTGWHFVNWSGDASGTSATITITMDSDQSITANFEADETGGGCDNPVTISTPFSKDGAGEFCWQTTGDISYINSWNLKILEVNGIDFTNTWSNEMPPKQDGYYNIHYVAEYSWAHFEIASTKSAEILDGDNGKSSDLDIHCYPNPVVDKLNIQFSREMKEIVDVYLIDVKGKVVLSDKAKGLSHTLDMSSLPIGLYTVKISVENQEITERIVKQ